MKTWLLKYFWLLFWLSFAANALPSITPIYDARRIKLDKPQDRVDVKLTIQEGLFRG
jgi:hypothetical protein